MSLSAPNRIRDGWTGAAPDRSLAPGASVLLELQFSGSAAGASGYINAVEFGNGCPVVDVR